MDLQKWAIKTIYFQELFFLLLKESQN